MEPTTFRKLKIAFIFSIFLDTNYGAPAEIVLTHLETLILAPDYIKIYDFHLVPQHGRKVLNGSLAFKRSMAKLNMRMIVDFEKPDKTRLQAMDLKVDICKLMNGDLRKQRVLKAVVQQMTKQKNYIQKCPIEANKTYDLIMYDVETPQFPLSNLKLIVKVFMYDEEEKRKIAQFFLKGASKRIT